MKNTKAKSFTVFSEGKRYESLRTKHALTWVVSSETPSFKSQDNLLANRAKAAKEAAMKVIAAQNLSKEEKTKTRRAVEAMSQGEIIAFVEKLRSYK